MLLGNFGMEARDATNKFGFCSGDGLQGLGVDLAVWYGVCVVLARTTAAIAAIDARNIIVVGGAPSLSSAELFQVPLPDCTVTMVQGTGVEERINEPREPAE